MSFTDLFVLLVIRKKVMSMTEFYNADAFDLSLMASHLEEVDRDALERMRLMVWAALAPNSKKQLAPEDVLTFSWEKEKSDTNTVTTREDFERAFQRFKKPQQNK